MQHPTSEASTVPAPLPYPHAEKLRDHWWWRPGWRVGRRFYTWFVTFEDAHQLHRLVHKYQQRLKAVEGLDLVPRDWLHLTVQGVAFTDDVGKYDLQAVIDAVGAHLASPLASVVSFHQAVVHDEAIVLPAIPQDGLQAIKSVIRAGIGSVLGEDRVHGAADGFRPHVTLAYNTVDRPASAVLDVLGGLEAMPVTVNVSRISLVALDRDDRLYRWEQVAEVDLG